MAKSKVKKSFFYYIFVLLGFVFGVFCILATILIFNPGEDIYGIGIRFVTYNKTHDYYYTTEELESARTKLQNATYSTVKFTSGFTNFNIAYDSDEYQTKVRFQPAITALSQSEDINLDISIRVAGGVLNIEVTEPDLWIGFSKNVTVYLTLPKNANFTNKNFDITTQTGAVQFGDKTDKQYEINSLKITSQSGAITLANNLTVKSGNVDIKTESSQIKINSNISNTLKIENITGKINIDEISGTAKFTNSGTIELNANIIGGDIYANCTNGYINIKQLGSTILSTGTVNGYIEPTSGQTLIGYSKGNFVVEKNIENTNIIIGKMTGDADIECQAGYVSIEKLGKKADIVTTSGSIEIKNAYNNVDALTTSGTITVTQNSNLAKTILISEVGTITANFTNLGSAELTTKGNINVNVKTGLAFKFVYNAKAIQVSWITSELPLNGYVVVSGASESTTTLVTANSENGKVTLSDGYIAK